jgi:DNA polymerase III delta prime subunit
MSAPTLDLHAAPAGRPERFTARWRLVAAGLSNVWRYGDLLMDAPSGRLLLRGPNGTGKTTALEALWPYLLDLNPRQMSAGKARQASLRSLMAEGATGNKRVGYMWLTFAGPGSTGERSYGVRVQWSTSNPVDVVPFTVPGRPVRDVPVHGPGRSTLNREDFTDAVTRAGGTVFTDEEEYRTDLAARVWGTTAGELADIAARLRVVRNPSLLADLSADRAAELLLDALPPVDPAEVTATADALEASNATRAAFEADERAAAVITGFADAWAGHVVTVVAAAQSEAALAARRAADAERDARRAEKEAADAEHAAQAATEATGAARARVDDTEARIRALKESAAYQGAQQLADRERAVQATAATATARWQALEQAAKGARDLADRLRRDLEDLREDLAAALDKARSVAPDLTGPDDLVTVTVRPRAVVDIAGRTCDPGPDVTATVDLDGLRDRAARLDQQAREHGTRAADAELAVADHTRTVAPAVDAAAQASADAARADETADLATARARRDADAAAAAATALCDQVTAWVSQDGNATLTDGQWEPGDVTDLAAAEPGQVLAQVTVWRAQAARSATELAAGHKATANEATARARALRGEATQARKQAARLRAGDLLPLPVPAWVDRADTADTDLFGACVNWADRVTDPADRARLEAAMAACGLLGAQVTPDGVTGAQWAAHPAGDPVHPNLGEVLTADPTHRLAGTVTAVLARIGLADTARPGAGGLVIGRDGTFTAGPVAGDVTAAGPVPAATHVGAHQRAQAALARAAELDAHADDLDRQADGEDATAAQARDAARDVTARAAEFPATDPLAAAETRRADRARDAVDAEQEARAAHDRARAAHEAAEEALREWTGRTTARGLPTTVEDLTTLARDARRTADTLAGVAAELRGRTLTRATRLDPSGRGRVTVTGEHLDELVAQARTAHADAAKAEAEYATLAATLGAAAQQVTEQVAALERDLIGHRTALEKATATERDAAVTSGHKRAEARQARAVADAAVPQTRRTRQALERLLRAPGVADTLAPDGVGPDWWAADPVAAAAAAVRGRAQVSRRLLADRYDTARAALATGGAWALDRGDIVDDLELFVLTHDGATYDPTAAAALAARIRDRARKALAEDEERALREFVIGRLPTAIGLAWQRQSDWVRAVNQKMRSASSSSGVLVQVRTQLRDDLSAAQRTVYELSCKVSDATRTPEQRQEVGQALTQLIAAAGGEDLKDKVAQAVDVRSWVRVHYEIDRGTGKVERWGTKTGLSGGERRLVVLAPMLAAAAAGYDGLAATGARLVALDEVPAEVDERGRQGLARYLADLDLDVIATSHLWDGSPGAWDGIDAYDLEAGSDQTVVAFPMAVRGVTDVPGDPW